MQSLGAASIIYSFTLANFDPKNIQMCNHLYPPAQVQFEVGFGPNKFHYRSPIFDVDQNSTEEQEFVILPDFVIGTHFRVNIIGKPAK